MRTTGGLNRVRAGEANTIYAAMKEGRQGEGGKGARGRGGSDGYMEMRIIRIKRQLTKNHSVRDARLYTWQHIAYKDIGCCTNDCICTCEGKEMERKGGGMEGGSVGGQPGGTRRGRGQYRRAVARTTGGQGGTGNRGAGKGKGVGRGRG